MRGIDERVFEKIMDEAKRTPGVRFADVRALEGVNTSIEVQDGRVEKIHTTSTSGAGVRVLVGNAWGFASSNSLSEDDARMCLGRAVDMARALSEHTAERVELADAPVLRESCEPKGIGRHPGEVPIAEKVRVVSELERAAQREDARVVNTVFNYGDGVSEMVVVNTRGTVVRSGVVRTRCALSVVAADEKSSQISRKIVGKQRGFELVEELSPEEYGRGAAREALSLLSAAEAPSGAMVVVFDPDITGLLVHEAFGHNSEADLVRSGQSIIAGRMGEKVGSDLVTIFDDATVPFAWGTYAFDGEGTRGAKRILLEGGVVRGFLHSLETAAHFGAEPQGSARCQDHQHAPIVRMSNTYFAPGPSTFEDLLRMAGDGLYIRGALGGYVSTEKGQFTCRASEGRLIRNGKLDRQVRDVAVSGLLLEALANVTGVSDAFSLEMPGTCGKNGQGSPVDAGGPHILVSSLVVGGAGPA